MRRRRCAPFAVVTPYMAVTGQAPRQTDGRRPKGLSTGIGTAAVANQAARMERSRWQAGQRTRRALSPAKKAVLGGYRSAMRCCGGLGCGSRRGT